MKSPRVAVWLMVVTAAVAGLLAQDAALSQATPGAAMSPGSLREWLTYLSSDELEGRNTFSEGLGLAAAYISERLREAGVKPGGDRGSYFQRVSVLGVRSTNRSTLTVSVNGQTRTFKDGEGVVFPKNVGAKRTLTFGEVEFVGYGLHLGPEYSDYKGRDVSGKAVVWLGTRGPRSANQEESNRQIRSRWSIAAEDMGAAATITTPLGGTWGRGNARDGIDFVTTQSLDTPQVPHLDGSDEFFQFLFSGSNVKYAELKVKSDQQEDLPGFTLKGVQLTFNLEADYQVVNTQYTRNVVGIVEGTDPVLKNTYIAFGCHYDHVGYAQGILPAGQTDRISNGADDDGTGTSTLIGLARAFAQGPKTKRSQIFVWHAGEERGLYGSRYFADHPTVPLDGIVAQLNIDMIGRNRDDKQTESNTVYAVGADRISTELHNVLIDANTSLNRPLTIDFEMNAQTDPERIYFRSDHYSYAAKGIPVIFFFTGLHPDYHEVTDTAEKIDFEKVARIGQLVYETGRRLGNADRPPVRDQKGPRTGRGWSGKL